MTEKVFSSFKAQAANSAETGVKKNDSFLVPVEKLLEEPGFNARDYDDPDVQAQIEMFAQAYAKGRHVPPITVRIDPQSGQFYLVDGHQRTRGAKLAMSRGVKIDRLSCVPFRGNNVDRVYCMVNSSNGLKLKPVAIARSYLRLINMGQTVAEIASGVQQKVPHVEAMLVLAEANADVQALVDKGAVSATTAIEVVRTHGEKAGELLAQKFSEAKAKGKTKVKPSSLKAWVPPRKMVTSIYSTIEPLCNALVNDPAVSEVLASKDITDESLEGKTVAVDAKMLRKLILTFGEAEALRLKAVEPMRAAQ